MNKYIRPRNGSELKSEIALEPVDPRSIRYNVWLRGLTRLQRIFIREHWDINYGPDADDLPVPEL
jgi:hypothetical protein